MLYITHPLSGLLMITLAEAYGLWLTRKFKLGWGIFGLGAITFVLSQAVHLPLNALIGRALQQNPALLPPNDWGLLFYAVLFGFTAGICEEGMRLIVLRGWAKHIRSWKSGVLFGAGHGGVEAAILGVLVLVNFFYLAAYKDRDLSALVPLEQLELAKVQIEAYWSVEWYLPLVGLLERVLTIPIHIAMTLMVLQVFLRKQPVWFIGAVSFHTAVNAIAVTVLSTGGVWAAEGVVAVFTLVSLGIIRWLGKRTVESAPKHEVEQVSTIIEIQRVEEKDDSDEKVSDSRYTQF